MRAVRPLAGILALWLGTAAAAPEIDHDAFWIESTFCTAAMKLRADASPTDAARLIAGLAGSAASCTGNPATVQIPSGGVLGLLQRGFRITVAQHQVVALAPASRPEADAMLLVTAFFVLERPATRLAPIPK